MHSPRPFGLHSMGGELTDDDLSFIGHVSRRLTNLKTSSRLENLKMVYDLPDGGFVIVQDVGGVFRAITHKSEITDNGNKTDGLAKYYVPMMYSGVVTKTALQQGEGLGLRLSEMTRKRLVGYSGTQLPPKDIQLQRFRIDYNDMVYEFKSQQESQIFISQYAKQRPTWYSGAMAEVMQIVGGYGRQLFDELPEDTIERAIVVIPGEYLKQIQNDIQNIRLPGYTGLPPGNGQFQFDYKFHRTNGITFDKNNQPWLIRVGSGGVHAMPLPLVPATTTDSFRKFIEDVGDEEIIKILDRFGGMPSGEGFPSGLDFETWRRAGVIIKVCSMSEFYSNVPYSSACGWSFNLQGVEGVNTCYDYDNDGVIVGKTYKLNLSFESAINRGWLKGVNVDADYVPEISTYLSKLLQLLPGGSAKTNAINYKLRRVTQQEIYQRASTILNVNSDEVDYWDNLELEPIAQLSGNLSLISKGYLYHYAKPESQPQIKFPSVEAGGCVSFDFSPTSREDIPQGYIVKCDTIMFAYFVENSIKVIKYFLDTRSYYQDEESNFEPSMTVGSWSKTERMGASSVQGHFYTTDFDFRETFSPSITTTTIKGEDRGFDNPPYFEFEDIFSMQGSVWRNRYYTHLTKTDTTDREAIHLGVCIPFFCRNSVILAKENFITGKKTTESLKRYAMRDPTSYRYWTYHKVWAWSGGLPKMTGKPAPVNGNPVWVEIKSYNPTQTSDFADQGDWLPGLPYDMTWLIHPNSNEWLHGGGGGIPKVKEYYTSTNFGSSSNGSLYFDISDIPVQVHNNIPDNWYFNVSPDKSGNIFYRDACKVVFGATEYVNISETDNNNRRFKQGYCGLVSDKSAYHFFGVINE